MAAVYPSPELAAAMRRREESEIRARAARRVAAVLALVAVMAVYPFIYFGMYAGDAEIHLVYGESAAEGRFFEFNPGEKSSGVTSVGYMLLLGQVFRFVPIENVPMAVKLLNIAAWYGVVALTFLIGRKLIGDRWALAAALVVGVMPGSVYNSTIGMENGLFALAVLGAIYAMMRVKWHAIHEETPFEGEMLVGALLALCVAIRPEGLPFAAVVFAYRLFLHRRTARQVSTVVSKAIVPALPLIAVTAALAWFHYSHTGEWIPGSAVSRVTLSATDAIQVGPFWFNLKFVVRILQYLPLTAFFLVGNRVVWKRSWWSGYRIEGLLIVNFWVFFFLYSTVLGSLHLARYITFLMPMMVLVAAVAARWKWNELRLNGPRWLRALRTPAFVLACLFIAAVFTVETVERLGLGARDELWRAMRAPAERQAYSDALLKGLDNPSTLPVSIAYQEVQVRYWLDDRFVVRSLDGRTDSLLMKYEHNGNYDHAGYIKERGVQYVAELVNYNRDPAVWALTDLGQWRLRPGQGIEQGGVAFLLLENGMFQVLDRIPVPDDIYRFDLAPKD
ncbi:MAG: hypothetical protein FJ319_13830 [SAR202 cluster bacterium]|nr:hypothetical protein [SAR202 cluster bacterium]